MKSMSISKTSPTAGFPWNFGLYDNHCFSLRRPFQAIKKWKSGKKTLVSLRIRNEIKATCKTARAESVLFIIPDQSSSQVEPSEASFYGPPVLFGHKSPGWFRSLCTWYLLVVLKGSPTPAGRGTSPAVENLFVAVSGSTGLPFITSTEANPF